MFYILLKLVVARSTQLWDRARTKCLS